MKELEENFDVEDGSYEGGPKPNTEMRLHTRLEYAICHIEGTSPY